MADFHPITKRCAKCKEIRPVSEFWKVRSRPDGLETRCRKCAYAACKKYRQSEKGKLATKTHWRKWRETESGRISYFKQIKRFRKSPHGIEVARRAQRASEARHPDRKKARAAVWYAVKSGKIKSPHEMKCADCEANANQYHHESYATDKWFDVTPLCDICHLARHGKRPAPTTA